MNFVTKNEGATSTTSAVEPDAMPITVICNVSPAGTTAEASNSNVKPSNQVYFI